jgi:4-alpha-glucanotransferase
MLAEPEVEPHRAELAHERRRLLGLLHDHGLLPKGLAPVMRGERDAPPEMPPSLAVAVHRLVARSSSRLFVAQAEDLVGSIDQVNIPGTIDEHPNWRRKLAVDIEALPGHPLFRAVTAVLREERPRR